MSNRIQQIYEQGQSIWCDNLSRQMLRSGELKRLIGLGIVGITSNPTIFMKAITGGHDYDEQFQQLLDEGEEDVVTIYERLVVPDISEAADILRPVYERTKRVDGFVSLEVNPKLAYDTEATVAEARRLFRELDRPNIFIKVPATPEGMPAIETLIGEGINVNVTLIFSIDVYREVMRAYLNGLKRLVRTGGDVSTVASVASFFVSRVDTLVDKLLEKKLSQPTAQLPPSLPRGDKGGSGAGIDINSLFGKAAVANAKMAYAAFEETFSGAGDFGAPASRGARVQRPLWASTSTKNPAYSDTMYVDPLIGPHTVNTLPPQTIDAVLDHAKTEAAITRATDESRATFRRLADAGIDMKAVTDQLTREGVDAFAKSFDEILENLGQKQEQLRAARA